MRRSFYIYFAEVLVPQPSDWVRQSMPFSYLSLEATSNDGQAHNVQVYSDISGGNVMFRFNELIGS